jgi:2-polyprenyl-3-methyl-5-hydroxy-6-metoxy-1,4-benzoquinol methylase
MAVAGHDFRRCEDCRSLWVEQPPPTEGIYSDESYYTAKPDMATPAGGITPGYTGDYLRDRPNVEAKFARVLEHVERYVSPGRLLDVGSGPGFLLSVARERGWSVRGVDLNRWAADHAREELGLDVTCEPLEAAGFEEASFDAVTMMDLIEHVADPGALIAEAARITRTGGVLVIHTPDAGAPVSRAMGRRWPEVRRAGEHLVLLSLAGAMSLLERSGYEPLGWHYEGKTSSLETLLEDVSLALPGAARVAAPAIEGTALGRAQLELDPHTKFVIYARRAGVAGPRRAAPVRLPKRVPRERATEAAILDELRELARARRLCDWMFEQFEPHVRGRMVEVGAGIGTFTERALAAGAEGALLIEPEDGCASELERRFGADARVEIARELLPDAPSLRAIGGQADFVLCQNVLEHIEDDAAATAAMAAALRPGGTLSLLVPAMPRLFGTLDLAYGHWRRYTPGSLRAVVEGAGLEAADLYWFNALGIPGWWLKNRGGSAGIGPVALRAYDAVVGAWSALERHRRPPVGLSLIVHARKP